MSSDDVIAVLREEGYVLARTRGSHWQFKHPDRPGLVTVPHPCKDLPMGTIRSIERQSGLRLRPSR